MAHDDDADLSDLRTASHVRVVFWDLDETFWRGTLDDAGPLPQPVHSETVEALASRGVVSSICSRNDLATAS